MLNRSARLIQVVGDHPESRRVLHGDDRRCWGLLDGLVKVVATSGDVGESEVLGGRVIVADGVDELARRTRLPDHVEIRRVSRCHTMLAFRLQVVRWTRRHRSPYRRRSCERLCVYCSRVQWS